MSLPAMEITHLRKTYGPLTAVDDVSLSVAEGEIFGILGPNGAGKTTTVECAIGLRNADSGSVRLLGLDPRTERDEVREIVGVQLQTGAQPAKLRVGEILEEYQSFYREPADVGELMDVLGLTAKRGDYYRTLSGGQRQRLSVALALVGRQKIAVLDEMPTGLDPQARIEMRELLDKYGGSGKNALCFLDHSGARTNHFWKGPKGPKPALETLSTIVTKRSQPRAPTVAKRVHVDVYALDQQEVFPAEVSRSIRTGSATVIFGGEVVRAELIAATTTQRAVSKRSGRAPNF